MSADPSHRSESARAGALSVLRDRVAVLAPARDHLGGPVPAGALIGRDAASRITAPTMDVRADGGLPREDGASVLYCAVVGSRAHGLDQEGSDVDRRGFYVAGARIRFSLDGEPHQLVNDSDQVCFWEVGKFVRLALGANPTVLETMYSPAVELVSPAVREGLDDLIHRGSVLSRRASQTFMGYADSQFAKMERALERESVFKWAHAMHLIRLLRVGERLVRTGELDVRVKSEQREELLAIKRGAWTWDDVTSLRADLSVRLRESLASSPLPLEPDVERAEAFVVRTRLLGVRGRCGESPA